MENITLEQIDLIMERATVSYSEAKEALEHTNGDTVEALLYLEKLKKIKTPKTCSHAKGKIVSFIDKLNATSFIMYKGDHNFVNAPLSIAILFIVFAFHISIFVLIVSLIKGVRFKIKGENELAQKINSTFVDLTK